MAVGRNKTQRVVKEVQGTPFVGDIKNAKVALSVDYDASYVTASNWQPYPALRTLDSNYDEFTCKLGLDTLRKMSMDSELSASIGIYLSAIFSRDMEFIPAIDDADNPYYEAGKKIANIASMSKKYAHDFVWEEELRVACKNFLIYGTSLIEHNIAYGEQVAGFNGYNITHLSPLSVENYRLAVDNFNRIVGILPYAYGLSVYQTVSGYLPIDNKLAIEGLLPAEKFSIYAFNRTGQDPRGSSVLTPAYPSWWLKQQLLLEFSAYIKRFAPILYGIVSERAVPVTTVENGVERVTRPVDALTQALKSLRNGGVAAFASGTQVGVLDMSKSGDFFINAIKLLDLQSARAVTKQHLASGEGEHQARSASEVHQDILILGIKEIKEFLMRRTRMGTMRTWTVLNFGKEAGFLTPYPSFGRGNGLPLSVKDVIDLHSSEYLTGEQYVQTDAILDLTPRAVEVIEQGKKLLEDSGVEEKTKEEIDKALKILQTKKDKLIVEK